MNELLSSGQTFAHYQIVAHLGTGGMGEVYKAVDTRLNRPVALKVLPAEWVEDKDRMRRFIQEAKSASALNHPHIVTIYEIGDARVDFDAKKTADITASPGSSTETQPSTAQIHYIAMEFIDGETLREIIPRDPIKMKKLLDWFADIADGLAAAHAAGIVHRDLKPDNVMIRQDGYAKIFDFGLAKLLEPAKPLIGEKTEIAGAPAHLTQVGVVMGTVGYMSPEQVQGNPVDHRSDIFSFGCILFEAVTRKKAFDGISIIDTLHKIVYASVPAITDLQSDASAELQRIIRKCLAKDVDERYQSIKEVATDLRELRKSYDDTIYTGFGGPGALGVQTGANQKLPNAETGARRNWLTSYLGFIVGGILIAGTLVTLYVVFGGSSTGRLSVESRPPGAFVFLDDELKGITPLQLTGLKEGVYRMRLALAGHETKTETFHITPKSDIQRSYLLTHLQVVLPSSSPEQSAETSPTSSSGAAPTSTPITKTAPPSTKTPGAKTDVVDPSLKTQTPTLSSIKSLRMFHLIKVKHGHGTLFGRSCSGMLRVNAFQIQYETDHPTHRFRIDYGQLRDVTLDIDKIIIQASGIPSGKMELQQQEKAANPSIADIFNRIHEFKKLHKDSSITKTPARQQ